MAGSYSTCRNSEETAVNRLGLCHKKTTDQNDFYTERKEKKQAFQRWLWKRIWCMFRRDMAFWIRHILRNLSKNQHGNFAVSSFVGFSNGENIHESESTRTLRTKASKLKMCFHNIHLHIFSIKLISPVIAVYKQTVFPISINVIGFLTKILAATVGRKSIKIYMKVVYFVVIFTYLAL